MDAKLSSLLGKYKECFPAHLPPEAPECNTLHFIPLSDNAQPPPRKSYHFGKAGTDELSRQGASILEKGYLQSSNSSYGHAGLFVKEAIGGLRMCNNRSLNASTVKEVSSH